MPEWQGLLASVTMQEDSCTHKISESITGTKTKNVTSQQPRKTPWGRWLDAWQKWCMSSDKMPQLESCQSIPTVVTNMQAWYMQLCFQRKSGRIMSPTLTSTHLKIFSTVNLSVLSFSACWPFLLHFVQKILQDFSLRDRLFCMAPV